MLRLKPVRLFEGRYGVFRQQYLEFDQQLISENHEVKEAWIDIHRFAIPMELVFASSPRTRTPPFVDVLYCTLDLIAPDDTEESEVANSGRRDYAHVGEYLLLMVGEVAKRLECYELINLMEVTIDLAPKPVIQTVHRG
ncbi:MAG: hypothetical protein J0H44_17370 [Alphaproteobacteria bacterium]|nr:hypothetical protein [Alphaproteobacteria bacterium]